jgi:hypothetical protein
VKVDAQKLRKHLEMHRMVSHPETYSRQLVQLTTGELEALLDVFDAAITYVYQSRSVENFNALAGTVDVARTGGDS